MAEAVAVAVAVAVAEAVPDAVAVAVAVPDAVAVAVAVAVADAVAEAVPDAVSVAVPVAEDVAVAVAVALLEGIEDIDGTTVGVNPREAVLYTEYDTEALISGDTDTNGVLEEFDVGDNDIKEEGVGVKPGDGVNTVVLDILGDIEAEEELLNEVDGETLFDID